MDYWEEKGVIIEDVRGGVQAGKLLFRLGAYDGQFVILLKRRGDELTYMIPVYEMIAPFVDDAVMLKKVMRVSEDCITVKNEYRIDP